MPEPGQEETVRVVALDRSFHVQCYKCEVQLHFVLLVLSFGSNLLLAVGLRVSAVIGSRRAGLLPAGRTRPL